MNNYTEEDTLNLEIYKCSSSTIHSIALLKNKFFISLWGSNLDGRILGIEIDESISSKYFFLIKTENILKNDKHSIDKFKPITNETSKNLQPKPSP